MKKGLSWASRLAPVDETSFTQFREIQAVSMAIENLVHYGLVENGVR